MTPEAFLAEIFEKIVFEPTELITTGVVISFIAVQLILLAYFLVFCFYNYLYSFASFKKPRFKKVKPSGKKVAVVIVSFNEKEVMETTIKACESLSYENKVIIVADDSKDNETYPLLKRLAEERGGKKVLDSYLTNNGDTEIIESKDLVIVHRNDNKGFKAGALKELEKYLKANNFEYMYLLDADWWPQKDATERCLEVIEADNNIAFVQTKQISYYGKMNFLQRCMALNQNGCYFVDLPGRQAVNDPILFSGCCTLFRLKQLYEVGGFLPGHLTEDIELTNRTYLHGYKGVYLEDVENEGEVPPNYTLYRKQQHRWAIGSARTFVEYLVQILESKKLSLKQKFGMLRQNAYFTSSIAIQASILLAILSVILISADSSNYLAVLYRYNLQFIEVPYTSLLMIALASTFLPPIITAIKRKEHINLFAIPYATWLAWSVLHTYFVANVMGLIRFKHDWFKTPKTNKREIKVEKQKSFHFNIANLATLTLLLLIYYVEWVQLGWIDIYSFFWIPALAVATVLS